MEFFLRHSTALNSIGLTHTLLCGGIVFGWSSLEHVLRREGVFSNTANDTLHFSAVFTAGTLGVYISNMIFGTLMDLRGAKLAGCLASLGFAVGLLCCSFAIKSGEALGMGFFLLGICGPAIQLTTIPFSSLFQGFKSVTIRSLQAAAFDGSSVVFYIAKLLYDNCDVSSRQFFLGALSIPFYTFFCELFMWPKESLTVNHDSQMSPLSFQDDENDVENNDECNIALSDLDKSRNVKSDGAVCNSATTKQQHTSNNSSDELSKFDQVKGLALQPQFIYLVFFTSIHILKLNFVIVSLNAQLTYQYNDAEQKMLLFYFGLLLPLGFFFMPVSTWLLHDHRPVAFQLANVFSLIYGVAIIFDVPLLQVLLTYPLISVSRQMVFSMVFQEVASSCGFQYFGTLMGIINIITAIVGCLQFAFVALAESLGSYYEVNTILVLLGLPLFFRKLFDRTQ